MISPKRWRDRQSRFFRCLILEDRHADIALGHRQNLHRANFSQSIRRSLLSRQGKERMRRYTFATYLSIKAWKRGSLRSGSQIGLTFRPGTVMLLGRLNKPSNSSI